MTNKLVANIGPAYAGMHPLRSPRASSPNYRPRMRGDAPSSTVWVAMID